METWQWVIGLVVWLALQVLQTIQIAIVGRQVKRTLSPPPMFPPPPPTAAAPYYADPFCTKCGALTPPRELRDGLCPDCVSTGPTQPAPVKAPVRPWHRPK